MIEDEFYDLETFRHRAEFLAKASLYQLYFNWARPNSHKGGLTPWQIVHELNPRLPPQVCLLPPVFLDYRLDSPGGYDLPRFPLNGSCGPVCDIEVKAGSSDGARASCPPRFIGVLAAVKL